MSEAIFLFASAFHDSEEDCFAKNARNDKSIREIRGQEWELRAMNLREWALPVYTILLQLATGALFALWIIRTIGTRRFGREAMDRMVSRPTVVILCTILLSVGGAHFHLSRPWLSFLALANIGSSWLSREIAFTVLFLFFVSALAILQWFGRKHTRAQTILGWLAIGCGTGSIVSMSEIYILSTQPAWDSPLTIVLFLSTTLLLGVMSMAALLVLDLKFSELREIEIPSLQPQIIRTALVWFGVIAVAMMMLLIVLNLAQIYLLQNGTELSRLSLQLLLGLYRPLFMIRLGLLLLGVGWLVATIWMIRRRPKNITDLLAPVYMACLLVLIGEILGRFLFYAMHIRLGI